MDHQTFIKCKIITPNLYDDIIYRLLSSFKPVYLCAIFKFGVCNHMTRKWQPLLVIHWIYTVGGSVWSPDSFSSHACWGAAVAGLHFYTHSFILTGQRGVQQGGACGGIGAWRQDPRWRAWIAASTSSSSHHGELVWSSSGGVIQVIWWRSRLERPILSLVGGVCRVRRRQVGVVPPRRGACHGCCHSDTKGTVGDRVVRWGVGECSCSRGVVNTGVREAGIRQRGERCERSF